MHRKDSPRSISCKMPLLSKNPSCRELFRSCRVFFPFTKNSRTSKLIIEEIYGEEQELNKTIMKSYLNAEFSKRQLELMILNFIIENNLSFELGERLGIFLNSLKEQHISQLNHISTNSKKLSLIVSNCIKPILEDMAVYDLKTYKFSLLLDIATDCIGSSHLCIMARYFKNGEVQTKFLKNIEIKDSMTGENINNLLKENILTSDLVRNNLIGLSTDNGRNFSGVFKGLYAKLKENYPNLFFQSCMCHNYDLIAEDAVKALPQEIIKLIKDISSEFSHSNTKKLGFEKIQEELRLPKKTPKKWVEYRWLSLGLFLEDFFDQLPAYMKNYSLEDKSNQKLLKNKLNIAFIAFLKIMTDEFCKYNKLYQSDKVNIFCLYKNM